MSYAIIVKRTGQLVSQPDRVNPVTWPNGDVSHSSFAGMEYRDWKLVPLVHNAPPNEFYRQAPGNPVPEFDGERVTLRATFVPHDIVTVRKTLIDRLNAAAETVHTQFLTPGFGQAKVYALKRAEVELIEGDANPTLENYPLLGASVGIDGDTLQDVAVLVRTKIQEWRQSAAAIERIRKTAIRDIEQAQDVDAAFASFQAVRWEID